MEVAAKKTLHSPRTLCSSMAWTFSDAHTGANKRDSDSKGVDY